MGFFDALRRVLGQAPAEDRDVPALRPVVEPATGSDTPASGAEEADAGRARWRTRLKQVLDELPASRPDWDGLMADARTLKLDPDWLTQCQVDEFLLLIRRAVSDRRFTEAEHRGLDLARDLIGIPEVEAEAALQAIVSEAETFFGRSVEGA